MRKICKFLLFLTFFATALSLSSCKKKWKKPTEVSFKFQLNSNSGSGPVKFTNAYILLNKMSIVSDRKQSPTHIELQQTFNNLPLNFFDSSPSPALKFDIPQGTYSNINVKYETNTDQNDKTLQINGTYVDSTGATLAVQFIFKAGDIATLTAENSSGGNEITLVEGHAATATIVLNPNYWFASIPKSKLDAAEQETVNNQLTITIDKDKNEDIYTLIVNRMKDGNQCIFN